MQSDKIKILVKWVNDLCQTPDQKTIDVHQNQIMSTMLSDGSKSPVFAVAIIQHLQDNGINLLTLTGEVADQFRERFGPHIERLGENDLLQIKKISSKLFT